MRTLKILFLIMLLTPFADAMQNCVSQKGLTLQVLGSGGPITNPDRASSGNLLWQNGKARVLIDAGGGVFLRFGQAGAKIEDLDFVGLTHLHADHVTDLIALLKSGYFSSRNTVLIISGPSGAKSFPSLGDYLKALMDPKQSAYPYLSGYLTGTEGHFLLAPITVNSRKKGLTQVLNKDGIFISAIGVPHGIVPALAYRININNKSVVFAGDQNGSDPSFINFARGADLLVMPMAIPELISGPAAALHTKPSRIGEIAKQTGAKMLVLTHFMPRSLKDFDLNLQLVKKSYPGPILTAHDLQCIPL